MDSPLASLSRKLSRSLSRSNSGPATRETAQLCNNEFEFVNFSLDASPAERKPDWRAGDGVEFDRGGQGERRGAGRRGVLWLQRGGLLSRWRESFCVLTETSLLYFPRPGQGAGVGACGKVRLAGLRDLKLRARRGRQELELVREDGSRLLVRATEGLQDWHSQILTNLSLCRVVLGRCSDLTKFNVNSQ